MHRPAPISRRRLTQLLLTLPLLTACGGSPPATPTRRVYFELPTPTPGTPPPTATAPPRPAGTPGAAGAPTPVPGGPAAVSTQRAGPTATPLIIPTSSTSGRVTPVAVRRPAPTGIAIPAIKLDARIVRIGTKLDPQGNLIWETAAFAVGHHEGSANPGENGTIVLSGHISSVREGAVFARLPEVKPGDGVILRTPERDHLYEVNNLKVVLPTDVHVLDPTGENRVILITCVPDRVYTHRLIVSGAYV
jgi:LPXTG-site transpeptidase (sortase) family protein